ncbi:MAG: TatD family hydrolase [Oscillospiraceae bacterium]|nr:TatD family hydrolase [Oscillospiraceae bacterium]
MRYCDSHAHYDDSAFDNDWDILLCKILAECEFVVNIGVTTDSSAASVELSERYDNIYAAVGIHPEYIGDGSDEDIQRIRALSAHKKVVAIGETGLDYHLDKTPGTREKQIYAFEKQLMLAKETGKPVIIHTRNAWGDTLDILKKHRPRGVVHCFSGSAETAREILSIGMYIGFTGNITYPNAKKARKALDVIPADRILVETDAPYKAPISRKGERCDSLMIPETISCIASLKGICPDELGIIITENTKRLFELR